MFSWLSWIVRETQKKDSVIVEGNWDKSCTVKLNSDDIPMRGPPCLDEELLTVQSARNILFRGSETSEEDKLLVSQDSVTQKIFGLQIRMALAKTWRFSSRSKLVAFSTRMFIKISHSETWIVSSSRGTSFESMKVLEVVIFILLRSTLFSISSRRLRRILFFFLFISSFVSPRDK